MAVTVSLILVGLVLCPYHANDFYFGVSNLTKSIIIIPSENHSKFGSSSKGFLLNERIRDTEIVNHCWSKNLAKALRIQSSNFSSEIPSSGPNSIASTEL